MWILLLSIPLFAEKEGDADKALRLLRDRDDANSRSAWFGLLCRVRSNSAAMDWFERSEWPVMIRSSSHPLGGVTGQFVPPSLNSGKRPSAQLALLEHYWSEMPSLPLVEGNISSAMLLPFEFRKRALEGVPLYQGITT